MADKKKTSKNNTSKLDTMAKSVAQSTARKQSSKDKSAKDKSTFAKEFKAELKRVTWPTPKQLVNNTSVVIFIVLLTAAIVFVLDVIFENVNKYGVEGIKSLVSTTETVDSSSSGDTTVEEIQANDESTADASAEETTEETESTDEQE